MNYIKLIVLLYIGGKIMEFSNFFGLDNIIIAAVAFLGGMAVGSNNPTWLSSKWREIKAQAEKTQADETLTELAKKVKEMMK